MKAGLLLLRAQWLTGWGSSTITPSCDKRYQDGIMVCHGAHRRAPNSGQRGSGKVMPLQIRGLQLQCSPWHHSAIFYSCLVKHSSPKWMVKTSWLSSRSPVHSCPSHLSADETASDCTEEVQSTRTNPFPSQSLPSWLKRNRNSALLISYFSTINLQSFGDQNLNKLVYFLPHLYLLMFKLFLLVTQ